MGPQFIKLAEEFYLNLSLVADVDGSTVRYIDGSTFELSDESLTILVVHLEKTSLGHT